VQCVSSTTSTNTSTSTSDVLDRAQVLAAVQSQVAKQFPQSAVLTAWRCWVLEQTQALQLACVSALNHVTTAHDVAYAQRLTLHQCLHFLPAAATSASTSSAPSSQATPQALSIRVPDKTSSAPATSGSSGNDGGDESQAEVWNAACGLLLLPFTLTSAGSLKRSSSSGVLGGVTLWSHVFRKPFITQVPPLSPSAMLLQADSCDLVDIRPMSCDVVCHVLSCHVVSRGVKMYFVMSCHVLSCGVM